MSYATALRDMDRAILKAIIACQEDDRVTIAEYGVLAEIRAKAAKLRHQQWQRDTFSTNKTPERITA